MGEVVLISGTDTGVGKTVAATWLAWRTSQSAQVALIKAAQTGAIPEVDGDEAFYRSALEGTGVTFYTAAAYSAPLAPLIAARREGAAGGFEGIATRCADFAAGHELALVEGSGGILVPIDEEHDFTDLAIRLGASVAIVVRPGLGTLNHTARTVEAAERRGLAVSVLICSGTARIPDLVESENLIYIRQRYPRIPLITIEYASRADLIRPEHLIVRTHGALPAWLPGAD